MLTLLNTPYLMIRSQQAGVQSQSTVRALAYLVLAAIDALNPVQLAEFILEAVGSRNGASFPKQVVEMLLLPVLDQIQSEVADVCASDCERLSCDRRALRNQEGDEIATYWQRLATEGIAPREDPHSFLRLERPDARCIVGFKLDGEVSCPLFALDPSLDNVEELLAVLVRVVAYRKAGAGIKTQSI